MNVKIIAHTPMPEKVVAASAKLCYSQVDAEEILEGLDEASTVGFLDKLMDFGHFSPLEHISFTFAIDGVSRALTHQLVRHRIASYSQQSQRYVKLDQFEYIVPPKIKEHPEANEIYVKSMEEAQESYSRLVTLLQEQYYKENISRGLTDSKARSASEKSAIEDARFVFPNACETKIVATMNARSLMNFFNHRCCNRAQWEIKGLADEMLKQVRAIAPTLFEAAGPKCLEGPCPEGKMTCGEIVSVRSKYKGF